MRARERALVLIIPGVAISNTVPLTNIDTDEIKAVLSEFRVRLVSVALLFPDILLQLSNVDVMIRQPNCTADDIVDVIEGNR